MRTLRVIGLHLLGYVLLSTLFIGWISEPLTTLMFDDFASLETWFMVNLAWLTLLLIAMVPSLYFWLRKPKA